MRIVDCACITSARVGLLDLTPAPAVGGVAAPEAAGAVGGSGVGRVVASAGPPCEAAGAGEVVGATLPAFTELTPNSVRGLSVGVAPVDSGAASRKPCFPGC